MHPRGSPCKRLKRVLLFPLGADGEIPRWIVATKESVGSFDPMFAPGVSLVVFVLVPSLLSSYDINHTRVIIPVKRLRNKDLSPLANRQHVHTCHRSVESCAYLSRLPQDSQVTQN